MLLFCICMKAMLSKGVIQTWNNVKVCGLPQYSENVDCQQHDRVSLELAMPHQMHIGS